MLKVITYNIHHANPPSKAKEGKIDIDAIAHAIKKQNPDIVGLQEVDKNTKRSGNIDEAAIIAGKAGLHYQFFKAIDHDGGEYGLAILSRYPIKTTELHRLPQAIKAEERILSLATIDMPGKGSLTFANTHLDATRPDSNRVVQMKEILRILGDRKGPVMLMGDLNAEPTKETIRLLDQSFKRSCTQNCGFTIPEKIPTKTIDYVAVKNADWRAMAHRVVPETYASDHRPVFVAYEVK
ncbi:hypothetical protein GCM10028827_19320 [Mucilaginibacter myungsuensis]